MKHHDITALLPTCSTAAVPFCSSVLHDLSAPLPNCLFAPLPFASAPLIHCLICPHWLTTSLPPCISAPLPHCIIALQPHCLPALLPHSSTAPLATDTLNHYISTHLSCNLPTYCTTARINNYFPMSHCPIDSLHSTFMFERRDELREMIRK
jgi:hypothetical protein